MESSEQKILIECQKGDLKQFSILYDKYIKKIYDFVYYKTHHKQTAEDLVSQTFIKALNNVKKFDISRGYFSAWLYQIARNTVIDYYRTKKTEVDVSDVWDLDSGDDIERDTDTKQQLEKVQEYIKDLKEEQRNVLIMRLWQGMSYKEIAQTMERSEASCKMTFSRAMARLRKEMPLALFIAFIININNII